MARWARSSRGATWDRQAAARTHLPSQWVAAPPSAGRSAPATSEPLVLKVPNSAEQPTEVVQAPPANGGLADVLFDWIPEPMLRQQVLVRNPEKLYGF